MEDRKPAALRPIGNGESNGAANSSSAREGDPGAGVTVLEDLAKSASKGDAHGSRLLPADEGVAALLLLLLRDEAEAGENKAGSGR